MNHGNEKHIKKDKSKVTISLAMEQICTNVYVNNTTIIEYPHCLYVLVMSRTRLRVNPHSTVA